MDSGFSIRNEAKRTGRLEILNYLRARGASPRMDMIRQLPLPKGAVALLVSELLQEGILTERGELPAEGRPARRGRRSSLLDINENCRLAFGVVMEGDALYLGLTNLKGDVLERAEVPLKQPGYREILEQIVEQLHALIRNGCIPPEQLLGAGICVSCSAAGYLEGSAGGDKLLRLRRDLSHALTMPVFTGTTIAGAISAQRLFSQSREENLLMLRYGRQIEAALLISGRLYRGASGRAGGFPAMQELPDGRTSYQAAERLEGTRDGTNQALNEKLARDLELCCLTLDPEAVYGFGSYFETESALKEISRILSERRLPPFRPCRVTEDTLFLAGCASAVEHCFYAAS